MLFEPLLTELIDIDVKIGIRSRIDLGMPALLEKRIGHIDRLTPREFVSYCDESWFQLIAFLTE